MTHLIENSRLDIIHCYTVLDIITKPNIKDFDPNIVHILYKTVLNCKTKTTNYTVLFIFGICIDFFQ